MDLAEADECAKGEIKHLSASLALTECCAVLFSYLFCLIPPCDRESIMSKQAFLGLSVALLVAACQPSGTEDAGAPATSTGDAVATAAPAPAAPEVPTSADPAPPLPDWSSAMMGKSISTLFPNTIEECMGGAGRIGMRFTTPPVVTRVDGWAWNAVSKTTFPRLIVTNPEGVIIGAGTSSLERQDVMDAHPGVVTELASGYHAFANAGEGVVSIYGIDETSKSSCKIADRPL